ncbi:hypothetical protein G6L37_07580 [Agrobacterium rubi]|nr:hypothetical protein [Agrobacterium rubi]NTF25229.1 hypothetical protein [Agrobacterium rubi]
MTGTTDRMTIIPSGATSTDPLAEHGKPLSEHRVPADLAARLKEIVSWRKTGVAELPSLRAYAAAKLPNIEEGDALRIAEDKSLIEAAQFLIQMAELDND